jgi:hypothetical protein
VVVCIVFADVGHELHDTGQYADTEVYNVQ